MVAEWRQHPVTQRFFKDIDLAIKTAQESPRVYNGKDQTLTMAGLVDGKVSAYRELQEWYEDLLEGDEENEI